LQHGEQKTSSAMALPTAPRVAASNSLSVEERAVELDPGLSGRGLAWCRADLRGACRLDNPGAVYALPKTDHCTNETNRIAGIAEY